MVKQAAERGIVPIIRRTKTGVDHFEARYRSWRFSGTWEECWAWFHAHLNTTMGELQQHRIEVRQITAALFE